MLSNDLDQMRFASLPSDGVLRNVDSQSRRLPSDGILHFGTNMREGAGTNEQPSSSRNVRSLDSFLVSDFFASGKKDGPTPRALPSSSVRNPTIETIRKRQSSGMIQNLNSDDVRMLFQEIVTLTSRDKPKAVDRQARTASQDESMMPMRESSTSSIQSIREASMKSRERRQRMKRERSQGLSYIPAFNSTNSVSRGYGHRRRLQDEEESDDDDEDRIPPALDSTAMMDMISTGKSSEWMLLPDLNSSELSVELPPRKGDSTGSYHAPLVPSTALPSARVLESFAKWRNVQYPCSRMIGKEEQCVGTLTCIGTPSQMSKMLPWKNKPLIRLDDCETRANYCRNVEKLLLSHGCRMTCNRCGDKPPWRVDSTKTEKNEQSNGAVNATGRRTGRRKQRRKKAWQEWCEICRSVRTNQSFYKIHGGVASKGGEKKFKARSEEHKRKLWCIYVAIWVLNTSKWNLSRAVRRLQCHCDDKCEVCLIFHSMGEVTKISSKRTVQEEILILCSSNVSNILSAINTRVPSLSLSHERTWLIRHCRHDARAIPFKAMIAQLKEEAKRLET